MYVENIITGMTWIKKFNRILIKFNINKIYFFGGELYMQNVAMTFVKK